jgi:hypothetical protein
MAGSPPGPKGKVKEGSVKDQTLALIPTPSPVAGLKFSFHLTAEDRALIWTYLRIFTVGPGLRPMFLSEPRSLDEVIDNACKLALMVPRDEVEPYVRACWSRLVYDALTRTPLTPPKPMIIPLPPAKPSAAAPDDLQSALGLQWTWHLLRSAPSEKTVQVQLTQGSGSLQRVYQFSVNLTTGDAQAVAGFQLQKESRKVKFLGGLLKGSGFLQLVAGINVARGTAWGTITFQVQAGVQATATWGPITVSVQLAPQLTLQQGQGPAIDMTATPQAGQSSLPGRQYPGTISVISVRF